MNQQEFDLSNASKYFETAKGKYYFRRRISTGEFIPIFRVIGRVLMILTIFPLWQIVLCLVSCYAFNKCMNAFDIFMLFGVSISITLLLLYFDKSIEDRQKQSAKSRLSDENYIFCLAMDNYVRLQSIAVDNDQEDLKIIRENSIFIKETWHYEALEFLNIDENQKSNFSYENILKTLNSNVAWISIPFNVIKTSESMKRVSTVTYAILKHNSSDNRLIPVYKYLYKAMYTKIWFDSRLTDISDTYRYLPEFNEFVDAVASIETIITSSFDNKENVNNNIVSIASIPGKLFKHEFILIRFFCWLVLLIVIVVLLAQGLVSHYEVTIDSKIVAIIISAPLAGSVLFSLNYK